MTTLLSPDAIYQRAAHIAETCSLGINVPQALIRMIAADYLYDGTWTAIDEDDRHCLIEWVISQIDEEEASWISQALQMRGFEPAVFAPGTLMSWDEYMSRRG